MSNMLAYIDPGTGAIAVQMLLAIVLSAGLFLRRLLAEPFSLFRRRRVDPPLQEQKSHRRAA